MSRFFAALLATAALAAAGSAPLTMLEAPMARCLDGTLSGFYHQPASDQTVSNKWVIHLQGGGECATQTSCDTALNTALGSSKVCMRMHIMIEDIVLLE